MTKRIYLKFNFGGESDLQNTLYVGLVSQYEAIGFVDVTFGNNNINKIKEQIEKLPKDDKRFFVGATDRVWFEFNDTKEGFDFSGYATSYELIGWIDKTFTQQRIQKFFQYVFQTAPTTLTQRSDNIKNSEGRRVKGKEYVKVSDTGLTPGVLGHV